MATKSMAKLHAGIGKKLAEIEILLERNFVPMPNITLFARDPNNDNMTIILSSETSHEDIRKAFEIVMRSASNQVEVTKSELLAAMMMGGAE